MVMTFLLLVASVACLTFCHGAQGKKENNIVFPGQNVVAPVPSRLTLDSVSFAKATKSVHYAAIRLLQLSRGQDDSNWVVSPVSLAAVLGQLMLGARGDFRRILGEILSPGKNSTEPPGLDVHRELGSLLNQLHGDDWSSYLLYINSALFIEPDIKLKSSYRHALEDIYNVEVFRSNFSTAPLISTLQINDWVKQSTFGRIQEALTHPVTPVTASLFINTVYFKGGWKTPFDPSVTKPGFFDLNQTRQVPVDYMVGEAEILYLEDPRCDCSLIGVPYENNEVYLHIFLPNKRSTGSHYELFDFASKMTFELMTEMLGAAVRENVTLILPRVKLSSTMSLKQPIAKAVHKMQFSGRERNSIRNTREIDLEAFSDDHILANSYVPSEPLPLKVGETNPDKVKLTFNMGGASEDYRFQIDDIIHRVELDINESGAEAAAVTTTLIDYFGGRIVRVNRPFFFLIRHEFTKTNLFLGTIFHPESSENKDSK